MKRGFKRTVSIILAALMMVTMLPSDVLNAADFSTVNVVEEADLNNQKTLKPIDIDADDVSTNTEASSGKSVDAVDITDGIETNADNIFTLDSGVVVTVEKVEQSSPDGSGEIDDAGKIDVAGVTDDPDVAGVTDDTDVAGVTDDPDVAGEIDDTDEADNEGYERVVGGDFDIDYTPEESNVGIDEAILGDGGEEITLPPKWTRTDNHYISSIKNQGHFGCCWSMSMMANAEAADMRLNGAAADETDFSEKHLVNFFYSDELPGPDGGLEGDHNVMLSYSTWLQLGGNVNMAAYIPMSWKGAAKENADPSLVFPSSEDKYYSYVLDDSLAYKDALHAKAFYSFNLNNRNLIKQHVKDYGAACISYTAITQCEKSKSFSGECSSSKGLHYYPKELTNSELVKLQCSNYMYESADGIINSRTDGGHAVTIVGWDDNFDKNNFKDTKANKELKYSIYNSAYAAEDHKKAELTVSAPLLPKENGAWLIKNSWGESYGDDGFYWISYEDAGLRDCVGFVYENVDSTEHIYQYDGSSSRIYWSEYSKLAPKFANIFTVNPEAGKNQLLDAVAVGIYSADTTVDVQVYINPEDSKNPESGMLVSEVKGYKTNVPGYYNIPLTSKPVVEPGTKVAVVAAPKLNNPAGDNSVVSVMYDADWDNVLVKAIGNVKGGQSFVCSDSTVAKPVWGDAINHSKAGNYRIKLYTKDTNQAKSEGLVDITSADVTVIYDKGKSSFTFTGKMIEPKVKVTLNGKTLIEGEDYILEHAYNLMAGKAVAAVKGIGNYSGTKTEEFTITKKSVKSTEFSAALEIVGGTAKISVYNKDGEVLAGSYIINSLTDGDGNTVPLANAEADKTYEVSVSFANYTFTDTKDSMTTIKNVKCKGDNKFAVEIKDPAWVLANCVYNGKAFKPEVVVKSNGTEVSAKSYAVTYYNNKNAGTALAVVKGKGDFKDYTGSCAFEIKKKKIDANTATIQLASNKKIVYNGKNQTPKITVKDNNGKALKLNTDYKVTYQNNKNAGNSSAAALVKFNDNYDVTPRSELDGTNQVSVPFTIEKAPVTAVKQTGKYYVFRAATRGYESSEITAEVKAGKTKLKAGDYKLEIDNVDVNSNKPNMEVKVVSLNPNYSSEKTVKYKLEQKENLKDAHISYVGVPYVGMRYNDIAGIGISSRVDDFYYQTKYQNGVRDSYSGAIYDKEENIKCSVSKGIKPGKYKIKLTATAKNARFTGSTTVNYEIYKIDLSNSKVNLVGLSISDKGTEYTQSDLEKILAGRAGYELKWGKRVIASQGYPALNIDKIFKDKCEVSTVRGEKGEKYVEIRATDDSKLFTGSVRIKLN